MARDALPGPRHGQDGPSISVESNFPSSGTGTRSVPLGSSAYWGANPGRFLARFFGFFLFPPAPTWQLSEIIGHLNLALSGWCPKALQQPLDAKVLIEVFQWMDLPPGPSSNASKSSWGEAAAKRGKNVRGRQSHGHRQFDVHPAAIE